MVLSKSIQKKARSTKPHAAQSHVTQSRDTQPTSAQSPSAQSPSAQSTSAQSTSTQSPSTQSTSAQPRSSQNTEARKHVVLSPDLLHDTRSNVLSLPLLVLNEPQQGNSTGSILLDSLHKKPRVRETAALRSLRLIEVSASSQMVGQLDNQADRQSDNQRNKDLLAQKNQSRSNRPKSLHASSISTASSMSTASSVDTDLASDVETENRTRAEDRYRAEDKASTRIVKPSRVRPPEIQSTQTQSVQTQSLSQESVSLAEPPQVRARSSSEGMRPVDDGKAARASAASVGLLDIDDTLLFGGTHGEISLADPYVMQIEDSPVYILAYLSQHVSAFAVAQLRNGFPNNAAPEVINRPDPPAYQTVLESNSFKLSDLDGHSKVGLEHSQSVQTTSDLDLGEGSDEDSLNGLNAQIKNLNAQLEYLRQKLEQAVAA